MGAVITWFATIRHERRRAKQAFRIFVAKLSEEIKSAKQNTLRTIHQHSSVQLVSEALIITEDICSCNRQRFEESWRAYCDHANKDFSKTEEWDAEAAKMPGLEFDYKLVREQLLRELELIVKYAA